MIVTKANPTKQIQISSSSLSLSTLRSHRHLSLPQISAPLLGPPQLKKKMAPPAPVAAAAAGDGQVQGGRQQGGFGQSIGGIIRMAVIWYFASKFFSSPSKKSSDPSQLSSNIFPKGEPLVLLLLLFTFALD